MPKRPATEQRALPSKSHAPGHGERPQPRRQSGVNGTDEMGEFEDAWEDEIESDEGGSDKQAEGGTGEDGKSSLVYLCAIR